MNFYASAMQTVYEILTVYRRAGRTSTRIPFICSNIILTSPYIIYIMVISQKVNSNIIKVEDVGFEPRHYIPNIACYHYNTSSEINFYQTTRQGWSSCIAVQVLRFRTSDRLRNMKFVTIIGIEPMSPAFAAGVLTTKLYHQTQPI